MKRFLVTFFALMMFALPSSAQAGLLIAPLRTVFDGRTQNASIALMNQSDKTRTYRITFSEKKQVETGGYEELEDRPYYAASPYLIISPRQVTLRPGERQTIRLSLQKPSDMAAGEYRSHLLFEQLPDMRDNTTTGEGIELKLHVQMNFAIPVIVRHEASTLNTAIESVAFTTLKDEPALAVDITRAGNVSSYGRLRIYDADKNKLGELNNVTVFPELEKRRFIVRLNPEALAAQTLYIAYEGDDEYEGALWDQKTLQLQ